MLKRLRLNVVDLYVKAMVGGGGVRDRKRWRFNVCDLHESAAGVET